MTAEIPSGESGSGDNEGTKQAAENHMPADKSDAKDQQDKRKRQRPHDGFEWTSLSVSIVLCVATIMAAGFAGWLAWLTHAAISDSHAAIESDQRAWVAPISATFIMPPAINSPIAVVMNYQNTGKSPAFHVGIAQQMWLAAIYPVKDSYGFKVPENPACKAISPPGSGGQTAYPSTTANYTTGIPTSKNIVYSQTLADRKSVLVWQGCFSYVTFGKNHKSSFCVWLRPKDDEALANWTWDFCAVGNDAD